jgi:hypothetical protein
LMGFILHFNGFCQNSTKPWWQMGSKQGKECCR